VLRRSSFLFGLGAIRAEAERLDVLTNTVSRDARVRTPDAGGRR